MANHEHLAKLKEGVRFWNIWRLQNPDVRPDLGNASLNKSRLAGVNLSGANLINARLIEADLSGANLKGAGVADAVLFRADLRGADASAAYLAHTNLCRAILRGTNLRGADLTGGDLRGADMAGADLFNTNLFDVAFRKTNLDSADLGQAYVGATEFADMDLHNVHGLESVNHTAPSTIGIDTIYRSQGKIPERFLRDAGVPETFITFMHSLVGRTLDYYSCFISYSSRDQKFAERLHADLQARGVRCWYAPEELKTGDKFRQRIDEAIRLYDKLLVVLSHNSIQSRWVEEEVEGALEKERKQNKEVLFPVRLDDTVLETEQAWAASLRRTRHIGDFLRWKHHDSYQKSFQRLLRSLRGEKD